jgi:hypothetical protein
MMASWVRCGIRSCSFGMNEGRRISQMCRSSDRSARRRRQLVGGRVPAPFVESPRITARGRVHRQARSRSAVPAPPPLPGR